MIREIESRIEALWARIPNQGQRVILSVLRPVLGSRMEDIRRRHAFKAVYRHGLWGNKGADFYSGVGSEGEAATAYVAAISTRIEEIARGASNPICVVDLGCGDFRIGEALTRRLPEIEYLGCDIVPELVRRNRRRFGDRRIRFRTLDIVRDKLPPGDVYLVRQVFQHLPNADILRVLGKLRTRRHIYVTEGHPRTLEGPVNPDKPAGADVRFDWRAGRGRGVELDQPPFNAAVEEILRIEKGTETLITWRVF